MWSRPSSRRPSGSASSLRGAVSTAVALAAVLALACAPGEPDDGTGSVAVFLTDAPADGLASVHVTVTGIELIGGDGPVPLFEGEETFDLLQLRNVSELFALADDVPIGRYRALRLSVDAFEIVVEEEDGSTTSHEPELPADGRWILVPDEPLVVDADRSLAVEVDIDVAKSIRATRFGARVRYALRPVVFLKILRDHFDGRLVRLHGVVDDVDAEAGTFELCRLRRPLPWIGALAHRAARALDARGVGLPERPLIRRCVGVTLLGRGAVFGDEGTPVGVEGLEEGGRATVIGHVAPTRRRVDLLAELALLGPRGTYTRLAGTLASEPGDDGRIDLALSPGQGFAPDSVLAVQLFESSLLFGRGGLELGRDQLEPGLRAAATGVVVLSDVEDDLLNAPVLIVELAEEEDPHRLSGSIVEIDVEAGELVLEDEDGELRCVVSFARTRYFEVDLDLGESARVRLTDLEPGQRVDAFGRPTGDGCFGAGVVIAFADGDGDGVEGDGVEGDGVEGD